MNHFPVLLQRNLHAQCASQARACVLCAKLLQCCCQKNDFEALFERIFEREITSAKIEKICWQITVAALMQPLQYDLRCSAAKDNSITRCTKQPWRSHYNAICRDWVAKHNRTTHNSLGNCSSKTGSRRQSGKKTILKHFLKGFLKGKWLAPKLRKSADKSLSQPECSHSNTIYDVQLQKTIVLRMQPRHQATLMQPLQNEICRDWVAKHNRTTHNSLGNCSSKTGSRRQSGKKTILKHFLKWFLKGKLLAPKLRKSADKSLSQRGCSHSNTIYDVQLQKTIVLRMQPRHQATLMQPLQNEICSDWVAKHNRTTHNSLGNCSSKTGSRRQSRKKTILKHFLFIYIFIQELQHSCSHSIAFYSMT